MSQGDFRKMAKHVQKTFHSYEHSKEGWFEDKIRNTELNINTMRDPEGAFRSVNQHVPYLSEILSAAGQYNLKETELKTHEQKRSLLGVLFNKKEKLTPQKAPSFMAAMRTARDDYMSKNPKFSWGSIIGQSINKDILEQESHIIEESY